MTATLAITGYGTLFQTGDTSSPIVYTTLAEVNKLTPPPLTRDIIDAGHESAPDEWREILTGLKTAGEVSLDCNFIKTTYNTLFAELGSTVIKPRRIVYPGGTHLDFDAFLTELDVGLDIGGLMIATAKFRASGTPSLTVV